MYNSVKLSKENRPPPPQPGVQMRRSTSNRSRISDDESEEEEESDRKKSHLSLRRLYPSKPLTTEEARRFSGLDRESELSFGYANVADSLDRQHGADDVNRDSYGYANVVNARPTIPSVDTDGDDVFTDPEEIDPEGTQRSPQSPRMTPAASDSKPKYENQNIDVKRVPSLPHQRRELTWTSAFDQIRVFLAKNRLPNELFSAPKKEELGGQAVRKLREYLATLDTRH